MAAWQADFNVILPPGGLPPNYRDALARLLPVGNAWLPDLEVWGAEDGDRIDVLEGETPEPELQVRFDLREWKPALYGQFLALVRDLGGRVEDAETGAEVPNDLNAFNEYLHASRAARFVRDPEAYLRSLKSMAIRMPEEP